MSSAMAAVAQSVKHPCLKPSKRGVAELTLVRFSVAAWEVGKILAAPSMRQT